MPVEPQPAVKSPPSAGQVDQHLHNLCKDRLMQGDLRRHALRWLIEEKRGGRWHRKPRPHAKATVEDFYKYAKEHYGTNIPRDIEGSGKRLFGELADALETYYAGPGADDSIVITLQGGIGGGYEPLIEWRSELPVIPPAPGSAPAVEPGGVTIYPNWDHFGELMETIERGSDEEPEDLRIVTIAFTSGGAPEDKLQHLADRGIRIKILLTNPTSGERLLRARNKIRSTCKDGDGETPEGALDALRKQIIRLENLRKAVTEKKRKGCIGDLEFCLSDLMPYGFVAHTSKWVVLGLFLATCSYGLGPMIVIDAAMNKTFWQKLKADWDARWIDAVSPEETLRHDRFTEHSHYRESVLQQIINDNFLVTEIEACTPEGADIWVAAPDLSNVGDRMSPFSELVRKIVRENAKRGVNYTYICPQGWSGRSRLENLNECFVGTSGKLHVHEVPAERFLEITLVPSHFISFNPLAERADAYMQLPLSQSQSGWIALGRKDAARVLAKMKQLINEYPIIPGEQV